MIEINGRFIGEGHPPYIIAEMSANHGQDFDRALEILKAMKEAGADCVKIQTYTPDTMTIDCDNEYFRIGKGTIWEGKTLYDLYSEAYTPWDWQPKLKEEAEKLGMDLFSTPYDHSSVAFLEEMDVPAYKVASFELTDLPLIELIAHTGKPIIMSTGMGSEGEIREAVETVHTAGNDQLILLKCTSAYPATPEEADLATIPDMRERFGVEVGLSDHTLENEVVMGALSLGACIIEKHFCLSRDEPGPDSAFSLEPQEFRTMVDAVRKAETDPASIDVDPRVLGSVNYTLTEKEKSTVVFRRSIFAVEDIEAGETFTEENVRIIRPAHGLPPKMIDSVLGKTAKKSIIRGTPLSEELIE